jgi:hypothetical protein
MAPATGFEPVTKWLTATYSTAELRRNKNNLPLFKKVRLILLYGIRSVNAVSIKNLNRKIKCDKPLLELVVYDGLAALQCPAFLCYLAG